MRNYIEKFPQIYYIKIKTYKPEIIKNARVGVKLKNFIKFCLKISKHLLKLCYTFLKFLNEGYNDEDFSYRG